MGHKCNHILSPKSLRAFTFSLHHCSQTIKIEMLSLHALHSLGWDNSHVRHMSSLKFDTLHLLWSADKTFEWNTASIVVQSVVWAAVLDRLQRKKERKKKKRSRTRETDWASAFWNRLFKRSISQSKTENEVMLLSRGGNLCESGNEIRRMLSVTRTVNPLKSLYSYYCNWVWE